MATTADILNAARELGKLISTHDATRKFDEALRRLQADTDAQRLFNDYNRHMQTLAQKEATGQPIEVAEKRQLQDLQTAMARNLVLRNFQIAHMDFLDLQRKVDEAIFGDGGEPAGPAAPAPGGLVQ